MSTAQDAQAQEPGPHDHRFIPDLTNLNPNTRALLETYSKIPADDVVPHIVAVRNKAWKIYPYPCLGEWRFLDLFISQHPLYPEILLRMKTGTQNYLDIGCALGGDIRRLVADGADSAHCFGSDLNQGFLDLGYELYRDEGNLQSKMIVANVLSDDGRKGLDELKGKMDIVQASSFLHLFGWEDQKRCARVIGGLLRPQAGSLVFGRQVAGTEEGELAALRGHGDSNRWVHTVESWARLWHEVGEEMGVKYDVQAETYLDKNLRKNVDRGEPNAEMRRRMQFSVRRLN